MSVLVSMKSALMSRTCSFNTPVNDGLPGSVKSEASILASGADENLRLFNIANVRFMLKGVYATWPNSKKNIFLKNVMSFLSLSSMGTTTYITSALLKLTHTGLGSDVTQYSITNSLSEILVYLNIQRCDDEIGTLTLSAGSKDCVSYGYTATFGGDNKQVFAPWWKNMTGVTGGKVRGSKQRRTAGAKRQRHINSAIQGDPFLRTLRSRPSARRYAVRPPTYHLPL